MTSGIDSVNRLKQVRLLPDGVYVDSDNGVAGTAWPIGTPGRPVDNMADAVTIMLARRLVKIYVHDRSGLLAPDNTPFGFIPQYIGRGGLGAGGAWDVDRLDFAPANNPGYQMYKGLWLTGQAGGTDPVWTEECHLYNVTGNPELRLIRCVCGGNITVGAQGFWGTDCDFINAILSATGAQPLDIIRASGILNLRDIVGGLNVITGDGLVLTIEASCTGGTISIYGDVTVIDNSNGALVQDYTNQQHRYRTWFSLNQGAASYNLYTTNQSAVLEGLIIKCPNAAAGGALTAISVQTDDSTPQVLISQAQGAVANLAAEAQLAWQGLCWLDKTRNLQVTIYGGATGFGYTLTVVLLWRSVGVFNSVVA